MERGGGKNGEKKKRGELRQQHSREEDGDMKGLNE